MNAGAIASYGIYNDQKNCNPKVVPFVADFSALASAPWSIEVDLTIPQQQNIIDFVQGVYIDNFSGDQLVTLRNRLSGQQIYCPPNSAIYSPIFAPNPPVFDIFVPGAATFATPVFFCNVALQPSIVSGS